MLKEHFIYFLFVGNRVMRVGETSNPKAAKARNKMNFPKHRFVIIKRGIIDDTRSKTKVRRIEAMYKMFHKTGKENGRWNQHEGIETHSRFCAEAGKLIRERQRGDDWHKLKMALWKKGLSMNEIADRLQISHLQIRKTVHNYPEDFPDRPDFVPINKNRERAINSASFQEAVRLYKEGYSINKVAEMSGRNRCSIRRTIKDFPEFFPPRRRPS